MQFITRLYFCDISLPAEGSSVSVSVLSLHRNSENQQRMNNTQHNKWTPLSHSDIFSIPSCKVNMNKNYFLLAKSPVLTLSSQHPTWLPLSLLLNEGESSVHPRICSLIISVTHGGILTGTIPGSSTVQAGRQSSSEVLTYVIHHRLH